MTAPPARAEARVDLAAIAANLGLLREAADGAEVMAVVKADGYGHGMLPVAATARAAGAAWLGVALPAEALALRAAGDTGPILAWLYAPGDPDLIGCVAAHVDLSVAAPWALQEIVAAATGTGQVARVHLKADTGLGRGGALAAAWPELVAAARRAEAAGLVQVVGIWSHLACADVPGHPATRAQRAAFEAAVVAAERAGLRPRLRHLASSGAVLGEPDTGYDLVRTGIAVYGLSPGPALGTSRSLGLRPAMSLRARLALVKDVPAGYPVSYGHTWAAPSATTLALVPVGYADGIPRSAGTGLRAWLGGACRPIVGRVAMDQVVVDAGSARVAAGDEVVLFGDGEAGEPTADEWAAACGTIGYEIVTRIGPRVPRRYPQEVR